jgi:hypothetical protein
MAEPKAPVASVETLLKFIPHALLSAAFMVDLKRLEKMVPARLRGSMPLADLDHAAHRSETVGCRLTYETKSADI